jgi:phospholipase A-2-activating protein
MEVDNDYQLCCQMQNHSGAVRCLGISPNKELLTGSRDKVLRRFAANESGGYHCVSEVMDHAHWITCIIQVPAGAHASCPNGGIVTGCQDNLIRIFNLEGKMVGTFHGHSGPVSSLCWLAKDSLLASGSWDGTVRLWDCKTGKNTKTIQGFENAVVLTELTNGNLATGTSGKNENGKHVGFTIRIYQNGDKIKEVRDHQQRITCLTTVPGVGFASSSNDGTVRLRDNDGNTLTVFGDMDNVFVMGVACIPQTNELVSVTDDGILKIWGADGTCTQEIAHPSSMWGVMVMENGDIVTAGSDKTARVFSRAPGRQADPEIQKLFAEEVENIRNKKARAGQKQIDPKTLTDASVRSQYPGKKDGDVKLFNKDSKAFSYRWDGNVGAWVEIGEVTGFAGEVVDGVMYDQVLPIEIEDTVSGTGIRHLKIGFNAGDNPWVVAQKFCENHRLEADYTGQIAQYIQQNRGPSVPTLDMAMNNSSSNSNSNIPTLDMANANGNMTMAELAAMQQGGGSKKAESKVPSYRYFPSKLYPSFGNIKTVEKIGAKIIENNEQLSKLNSNKVLTAQEIEVLETFVVLLKSTSHYHVSKCTGDHLRVLGKALTWSPEKVWPVIDLFRCALLHEDTNTKVGQNEIGVQSIIEALKLDNGKTTPLVFLSMRCFTNMLSKRSTRNMVRSHWFDLLACTSLYLEHTNKNVRTGVATVLLGIATMLHDDGNAASIDGAVECLRQVVVLMKSSASEESSRALVLRHCMVAVGTLLYGQNETYRKAAFDAGLLDQLPECSNFFTSNNNGTEGIEMIAELNRCLGQ